MATIHIPVAQAALDLPGLLDRARAGEDIVIDSDESPGVNVHLVVQPARQTIEETIARIQALDEERGCAAVMDPDFADDLEDIIGNRKPRDTSAWD